MYKRVLVIVAVPLAVLLLGTVLLVVVGAAPPEPGSAQATVFYVDDDTCPAAGSGTQPDPFCTIQAAVDATDAGDEIRAATGKYGGAQTVAADPWGGTQFTYTQVVFTDKGLSLLGGYDPGDWETSDPSASPTVIDAGGYGRCITILDTDYETVTVDGFTLTGGDYTGLGNPPGALGTACHGDPGTDCGGGIYSRASILILRNSVVTGNVASHRENSVVGGIYLWSGEGARIEETIVAGNSVPAPGGGGGGMYAMKIGSPTIISGTAFQDNYAAARGGGMQLYDTEALVTVEQTAFLNNVAAGAGGGGAQIRLAQAGGQLHMDRVRFQDNHAQTRASALLLDAVGLAVPRALLSNLLLSGNGITASTASDAVIGIDPCIANLDVSIAHVTAADNQAPAFLFAKPAGYAGRRLTVTLTNTLLVSFTNALAAREGVYGEALIRHVNTLVDDVTTLQIILEGSPTFEAVTPLKGESLLDTTYHLQPGSAAIDAGVDAGVHNDIDGQTRPYGRRVDIGADEFVPLAPESVSIVGPATGFIGRTYAFEALVSPPTASGPFTYTWLPEPDEGQGADRADYLWMTEGVKAITVTAANAVGTTPPMAHEILVEAYKVLLPLVVRN